MVSVLDGCWDLKFVHRIPTSRTENSCRALSLLLLLLSSSSSSDESLRLLLDAISFCRISCNNSVAIWIKSFAECTYIPRGKVRPCDNRSKVCSFILTYIVLAAKSFFCISSASKQAMSSNFELISAQVLPEGMVRSRLIPFCE